MAPSRLLYPAALSLVLVVACGNDEPVTPGDPLLARQLPAEIAEDAAVVVAANNAFALDVYKALPRETPNAVFSAFSMSAAFSMVQAGARGTTEAEIATVFHFPQQERLHPAWRALLASLETGADFGGYRLHIANRLWGQEGLEFLPDYLRVTREEYGAELARVDFANDPEDCRTQVNRWVEGQTENRIKDLMPAGSITELTRLVLANAIYFKGTWQSRFDPEETQTRPFRVTPTESIDVPLMRQEGTFALAHGTGVDVLELPYRGKDLAMVILLPEAADGLPALEEQLTIDNLNGWLGALTAVQVSVYLPRFEINSTYSLKQVLAAMGMPSAFDPGASDLTGMLDPAGQGGDRLFIGAAVHKGFIKVDEEGTEAAAATGVSIGLTSMPPTFRADRPFVYLIRDKVTGSILFLGRVERPA